MSFTMPLYRAPNFDELSLGNAPDASWQAATQDGVAPQGFHSTSMYPEYVRRGAAWQLIPDIAMDDVVVQNADNTLRVVPERELVAGDLVLIGRTEDGSEGILVWADGFEEPADTLDDRFSFRTARSRETSYAKDYDELVELLRYEKEHGRVLWVMGPAFTFDADARIAMQSLIEAGYVDAVMGGNALAVHDLEAGWLRTALGQDIYTQESRPQGHYNHVDVINAVRRAGSMQEFIKSEQISDGIMYALLKHNKDFVLAGSIRDDGPLPEVIADVYEAQAAMYAQICKATTIVCMATMLHTIATGNLAASYCVDGEGTVRPKYFYAVDAAEFALNKLLDRGSLAAKTIVTNARDFIQIIAQRLKTL